MQPGEGSADLSDICREMGNLLSLGAPVDEKVLVGALQDEAYAHNLLVARRQPAILAHLLKHPPRGGTAPVAPGNLDLVQKASQALWEWARTGFSTVEAATLEKRLDACGACPHQAGKPDRLLYRVAGGRADGKICGLCGCPIARKALLESEACPDVHPDRPGFTRWEEPIGA